jgi:Protein of unknown function (DUF3999)/F5/8 type C domain
MKLLLALLLAPALSVAAEQPQDFAFGLPVEVDGREALYEVEIPASVHQGTTRPDLGDLRVFNADGEPVPFALEPRPPQRAQTPQPVAAQYFPLYGEQPGDLEGLRLKVEKSGTGTVVSVKSEGGQPVAKRRLLAYLVDVSALKQPYAALELDWRQDSASYATNVRVEASDDLKTWTTVVPQAPLVRIDHDGQRLEQRTVEFQPRTAKYLRLSWPASAKGDGRGAVEPLELTRVTVRTGDVALEPERAWREALPEAGEKPGEYLYDLGGQFPVERIRFALPQQNTIARVEVFSRPDPRRDWQLVTSGVIYRLTQQGHQVSSPDLAVATNTNRNWLLRVDQKGGGLGSGLPRLSAGWVPQKLVFAARGKGPFQIAYGSSKVQPAAYPIETVVPGWRSDQQPKLAHAELLPERLLGGAAALHRPFNYRVFGLWGALVLGVLLLAWMAWRLSKQMQSPPTTEARKAD